MKHRIAIRFRQLAGRIYRGPLGGVIHRLGLDRTVEGLYFRLFKFVAQTLERSVRDVSAEFHIDDWEEYKRAVSLMGEEEVIDHLLARVSPEDVFYDVGANTGIYGCFVGSVVDPGHVVALEPHPANIEQCRSNLELNDVDATLHDVALSDEDGTASLQVSSHDAGAGTHSLSEGVHGQTIQVETRRGDSLIAAESLPEPTVLKIDVEGAEVDVLRGLERTLEGDTVRCVYCEVHPGEIGAFGNDAGDVEAMLQGWGFETERILDRGGQFFVFATK